MTDLNLSTSEDLLAFLADGPFASSEAIPLVGPGGGTNFTFRLLLHSPYHGKPSVIVKHGKPYISRAPHFPFDLARQEFEVEAAKIVGKILPLDSPVAVPAIYLFDDKAHVIIMEDISDISTDGSSIVTLRDLLLRDDPQRPTEAIAGAIGASLGTFLSTLHRWGSDKSQEKVLDFYEGNKQGRNLYAWANYARLHEILSDPTMSNLPALTDPPIVVAPSDLATIEKVAQDMLGIINKARDTLLHGDFWPGNVLVVIQKGPAGETLVEKIAVVDWEFVKPGSPAIDVGQFLAELHQTQRLGPPGTGANVDSLRSSFLRAYKEGLGQDVNMENLASISMTHMGGHLASWTARSWKSAEKERIRGVVADGVNFLVSGSNPDKVNSSPLGLLTSKD